MSLSVFRMASPAVSAVFVSPALLAFRSFFSMLKIKNFLLAGAKFIEFVFLKIIVRHSHLCSLLFCFLSLFVFRMASPAVSAVSVSPALPAFRFFFSMLKIKHFLLAGAKSTLNNNKNQIRKQPPLPQRH